MPPASRIIGIKEIAEIGGLDANSKEDSQRISAWLNRNRVPYVRIGRAVRGKKSGVYIIESDFMDAIRKRRKVVEARRQERAQQKKLLAED